MRSWATLRRFKAEGKVRAIGISVKGPAEGIAAITRSRCRSRAGQFQHGRSAGDRGRLSRGRGAAWGRCRRADTTVLRHVVRHGLPKRCSMPAIIAACGRGSRSLAGSRLAICSSRRWRRPRRPRAMRRSRFAFVCRIRRVDHDSRHVQGSRSRGERRGQLYWSAPDSEVFRRSWPSIAITTSSFAASDPDSTRRAAAHMSVLAASTTRPLVHAGKRQIAMKVAMIARPSIAKP